MERNRATTRPHGMHKDSVMFTSDVLWTVVYIGWSHRYSTNFVL